MRSQLDARVSRANKHAGYSLIELLVVIAIIGILAAIAIPALLNQRAAARNGQVEVDLRNAVYTMEGARDRLGHYPTSLAELTSTGVTITASSSRLSLAVVVQSSGLDEGFILYARSLETKDVYLWSSYGARAVQKSAAVGMGAAKHLMQADAYGEGQPDFRSAGSSGSDPYAFSLHTPS